MSETFTKLHSKLIFRILMLGGVLSLAVVILSPRWLKSIKWNSWTLQFIGQVFDSPRSHGKLATIPPGHEQGSVWLARQALSNGDAAKALDLIQALAQQNDTFALRVRVSALEQLGDFSAALQALKDAGDYSLLIQFGDRATLRNDANNALAAYGSAWKFNPEMAAGPYTDYLINRSGDLSLAESILRKALAEFPKSNQRLIWYHSLGDDLKRQKNYAAAIKLYQAALVENPRDWASYIGLGWAYYEDGHDTNQAIQEFQKAIDMAKNRAEGYFAMAILLTREGKYDDADAWYGLALQRNPASSGFYVARANNARYAGKLDLALSYYQEAAAKFPEDSSVYYEMAWGYRLIERPEQAISSIEKAVSLMKPLNVQYYLRAAEIYAWDGKIESALAAYRKVLAMDPDNDAALKGMNRLSTP